MCVFTDRVAPTVGNVIISSTSVPGYATIGNSVSVSFTTNEVLSGDTVLLFNFNRQSFPPTGPLVKNGLTYTATVDINSTQPAASEEGQLTFSIAVIDTALNPGQPFLSTAGGYSGNVIVGNAG